METFIGIDLGSTTTKAVVMDESQQVLGRGITNSRSNTREDAEIGATERTDGNGNGYLSLAEVLPSHHWS